MATLTAPLGVALNTVAATDSVVEDLSPGVTLTADVIDQIVTGKAPAGPDDGVPDLVVGTGSVADTVGSIIDLSRGTQSAAIPNKIVAFLAKTFSIDIILVSIA